MDSDDFKEEIRSWISWAEGHYSLSEDFIFLRTDSRDETEGDNASSDESDPWMDNLSEALDGPGSFYHSFLEAAEDVLVQDPLNIYARCTILEYLEAIVNAEEWVGNPDDIESGKDQACALIKCILPLAPVEDMHDWPMVAWEIGTAGWASDHDRALRLFDHALAHELAPRRDLQLLRARHLFFVVNLGSIYDLLASEVKGALPAGNYGKRYSWLPFLGTDRSYQMDLFIGAILLCHDVRKLRTNLTDEEKAHLRYAIADIENAGTDLKEEQYVFNLILPACLYSIARYHEAANAYKRLLLKYTPETNRARIPVYRSIAVCHESAGELQMSDSTLAELLQIFPGEQGIRRDRIRLLVRQNDRDGAFQMLKEEDDLDSNVSADPVADLALTFGKIASEKSSADFSSAIARRFLEQNPGVSSLIDALHGEYWPTYRKLSDAARKEWRFGTTQLHYFSTIEPSQSLKAKKESIKNFAKAVELEIHDFFLAFRERLRQAGTNAPIGETRKNASNALQQKFIREIRSVRGELKLGLGEMYGLLALYRVPPSELVADLADFHGWLQQQCQAIFGVVRDIEEINSVRNPATHADFDAAKIEQAVKKCRRVLDAIKGR